MSVDLDTNNLEFVQVKPESVQKVLYVLLAIGIFEQKSIFIHPNDLAEVVEYFKGDLRKVINEIQLFYHSSFAKSGKLSILERYSFVDYIHGVEITPKIALSKYAKNPLDYSIAEGASKISKYIESFEEIKDVLSLRPVSKIHECSITDIGQILEIQSCDLAYKSSLVGEFSSLPSYLSDTKSFAIAKAIHSQFA